MRYTVKLPFQQEVVPEVLNFGGTNPKTGESLGVTKDYFTRNGEPWYPVMGEFHFSRYNPDKWEEEILKMKAGGIEIIATYIFWIHHEEIEGQWDWSGQRNLRQFVEICDCVGVYCFLRLGPWNHGECRNGGFPDWLVEKDFELRSDNDGYLPLVDRFYVEIFAHAEGLLFKDGGPVIGVQIENEYGHCGGFQGEKGEQHMRTLTNMAREIGFEVPYYTATGWGGAVLGDCLPVMGAYADAPWDRTIEQLPLNENFLFSSDRNDEGIGSDFVDDQRNSMDSKNFTFKLNDFPWVTAELGGGIMVTKHRRPIITAQDTEAMIFSRIGSGANLVGYYMYHGGTNPEGKLTTLNEKKPRDWCDLPIKCYDFQGVIGEAGLPHQSYYGTKIQHMFLNDFGSDLASKSVYFPEFNPTNPGDTNNLRMTVRYSENAGYVFLNNYQRHLELPERKVELALELSDETINFPEFTLKNGQNLILPFNMKIGAAVIKYATAQPLCKLNDGTVVFWNYDGVAEFAIEIGGKVNQLSASGKLVVDDLKILVLDRSTAEKSFLTTGRELIQTDGWYFDGKFAELQPVADPVNFEIVETRGNGDLIYKLNLPECCFSKEEMILNIDFDGNIANLFMDGKLVKDWFYTGLDWNIALDQIADLQPDSELLLQIKPLKENDEIYLEQHPHYEDGVACKLNGLGLKLLKRS